jgi:hypothetical protein
MEYRPLHGNVRRLLNMIANGGASVKKTYFSEKSMMYVVIYVALAIGWMLRREPWTIIVYMLIMLAVIAFSKRRYFPFFSKLEISDERVEKTCFGRVQASLSTDRLHVMPLTIYKTTFAVFLTEPHDTITIAQVKNLLKYRLAILYPYQPQMKVDLPELFVNMP